MLRTVCSVCGKLSNDLTRHRCRLGVCLCGKILDRGQIKAKREQHEKRCAIDHTSAAAVEGAKLATSPLMFRLDRRAAGGRAVQAAKASAKSVTASVAEQLDALDAAVRVTNPRT